nr:hypothetical protein GCM10020092_061650 [Actinoplanes digitatis]
MNRRTILGLGAAAAVSAATVHQRGGPRPKGWLHTWVSMPQLTEPGNMPPAPFNADGVALADTTLRQTVQTSIAGSSLRVRFSNAFGGAVLPITGVTVALPLDGRAGASAIVAGSARAVTFSG